MMNDSKNHKKHTTKIAIIGGTYLKSVMLDSGLLEEKPFIIETPVGRSPEIWNGSSKNIPFYYVHDHGSGKFVETWAALYQLGVKEVIGGATAGGINPAMKTRDFVVPNDFIDFNFERPRSLPHAIFNDDGLILPRYTPATDPYLDEILLSETKRRLDKDSAFR
ncbi:phosphorylase family protein [Niallia sp. 03133]|uniref:phosphorylase family protein n=1 Tax=Niallia sp. 03133 TaxID=3458060 RepID=UPI004043BE78